MGDAHRRLHRERAWRERIKLGLRASLQTESLVTGVLYVDVRLNPNAPPPVFHQLEKIYPELPTEPTQIQQLFNNLASLDIKSIETNLNALLTKLDTAVGSLNMAEINQGITNLLASVNRLVTSPDITNGLAAVRPTLDQYRVAGREAQQPRGSAGRQRHQLARGSQSHPGPVPRRGGEPADHARARLAVAATTSTRPSQQLAGAAQSISALVDFLKQHPNALITGRETSRKKP